MDGDRLLDALGNEHARAVLTAAADGPRSVDELTDRTDASRPTVYRQVEDLQDLGLLEERRGYDDGTHYRAYETRLETLAVEITARGIHVGVEPGDDPDAPPADFGSTSIDDGETL